MNRVALITTSTAVLLAFGFQQLEIQSIADETQDIKDAVEQISKQTDPLAFTAADEDCMAKNIYYEAGVEPVEGKFAVAQVTLNRLRTGQWGNSICSVVHAKAQFSWTLKKKAEPKGKAWRESKYVAHDVLFKQLRMPALTTATYYHADYVNPKWNKTVVRLQQIGKHIFYQKS